MPCWSCLHGLWLLLMVLTLLLRVVYQGELVLQPEAYLRAASIKPVTASFSNDPTSFISASVRAQRPLHASYQDTMKTSTNTQHHYVKNPFFDL